MVVLGLAYANAKERIADYSSKEDAINFISRSLSHGEPSSDKGKRQLLLTWRELINNDDEVQPWKDFYEVMSDYGYVFKEEEHANMAIVYYNMGRVYAAENNLSEAKSNRCKALKEYYQFEKDHIKEFNSTYRNEAIELIKALHYQNEGQSDDELFETHFDDYGPECNCDQSV